MNAISWKPPVTGVPARHVALWNAAMSHMEAELPLGPDGAVLRLSPISAPDLQGGCAVLHLKTGGAAYFHLDAYPFQAMLNVAFDIADLRALGGPLHEAIYQGAVQSILDVVPQEFSNSVSFGDLIPVDAMKSLIETSDLVWFAAILEGLCPAPAFFSVGLAAEDLCEFLETRMITSRTALAGLKSQIEKPMVRFVGTACLISAQVSGLETGDLIILDHADLDGLALQDAQHIYHFEAAEAGWHCTAVQPNSFQVRTTQMEDPLPDSAQPAETDAQDAGQQIAEIAQTLLTFDLGEVSLPLAELEQLQVGAIVSLPDSVQTAENVEVSVRIAGRKIATGDLVQIDDRVAVRLNAILVGK